MNDILTNGTEIKQRIISEIRNSRQSIYLAMAWFTDRDIAGVIIESKNRGIAVDIILSSNAQNETVKGMLREANVNLHAFETGDERGMMHHKFCLIDNKITLNGSYNYSYNASNNNVENIQISDDPHTYRQFLSEFERLRYNIDHQINVNETNTMQQNLSKVPTKEIDMADSFTKQLSDLVYATANINTDEYKKLGYENSKESSGNIHIFSANYGNIKEQIRMYATDVSLSSKKSIMVENINSAYESKKKDIEAERQLDLQRIKLNDDLERKILNQNITTLKQDKSIFEAGNQVTAEKGLLQINNDIEKNKLEKRSLESSFVIKKFWTIGNVFAVLGLFIFAFYLSVFFASAIFKVFFESNEIRKSLEAGINPGIPQLIDANAIVKIFRQQGILFGIIASLFFVIPILVSNLKLIGSKNKTVNTLCFWLGLVLFDVVVSTMVALNTDEIKSLLIGQGSQMQAWEVIKHGEFYMIFTFGMLPLFITHFIIDFIVNAYTKSRRELVDSDKHKRLELLERDHLDLAMEKEILSMKLAENESLIKQKYDELQRLDRQLTSNEILVENNNIELLKNIKIIYEDFMAKISTGKVFTEEILSSVTAVYKSGYIEYLPELYAEREVANRVKDIEQIIKTY
ncbi:phospholipase D-like domain-containing protein [Pedobacter frigidisoli]|uniref:phospholipase D-like domain-containing protein n=1 Tax=Pedobacter frigidisoli TaxID=2530455 RepID=UPI00292E4307|nr:phospholipase D-like domain-containing protein [Pedobacter frigidisoli]